MKIIKRSKINKKIIVPIAIALLILIGGVAFFVYNRHTDTSSTSQFSPDSQKETEVGRQQADKKGSSPETPTPPPAASPSTDKNGLPSPTNEPQPNVTPTITYAGYQDTTNTAVEVDAYVSGIFEAGACTLNLVQGTQTITRTVKAAGNATTTSCANFIVERSAFPSGGVWSATVVYSSTSHHGTSAPTNFTLH